MLTATYTITSEDFDAFVKYSVQRMRQERRMTAIGGGALFSGAVMYALLNWLFFEPAWALFFSVLFVALLGLLAVTLPRSGRWKGLIQEVNGRSVCWTAGPQKIAVDDGGIEISSSAGSARTSWDAIDELAMTRTHAFLIFPHLRACVIPIATLSETDRVALLQELKTRIARIRGTEG